MALPSGYTQLQFITFNGAQYIKTGVKTPSNSSEDIKITCKFKTTTASKCFFGGRESTTANGMCFGFFSSSSAFASYGGATSQYTTTINCMNGATHTVLLSKNLYTIDGTSQTISNRATPTTGFEIYLGTWNNNGSVDSRYFSGQVYSFTVYKNCARICDLIPCKDSSGNVGFYDIINFKFITNSGTGSFTAGTSGATSVTYKTVISKAVQGFNDIQGKLAEFSYLNISNMTESSTGKIENVLTADKLRKNIDSLSVIVKSENSYISGCHDVYNPTNDGGTIE